MQTTYDSYYNTHMKILHEDLHYNQTHNTSFNHDCKILNILVIKDV